MTSYQGYSREPALARSPAERDTWSSREDIKSYDRPERADSFYRGRSPGPNRHRRQRSGRSRSPLPVDRYEPSPRIKRERDDYRSSRDRDRDDRDRRRPSPGARDIDRYVPGFEGASPPITVNPLADPAKLPFQVGFSYFGEWWRTNEKIKEERERLKSGRRPEPERARRETAEERDKEKARIQVGYDSYKEELQARMATGFVQERKNDQWFQEKYVAEVREPLRAKLNEFRRDNYANWARDFEAGVFDEFSLEGIPKNDVNGTGGLVEKEEGEATAANEILGVGDLVPVKGSDIRDVVAFQPTLLIKTIAPHVSRAKLVDFCKEHLGDGEGGFRWLSLSDPNPSKRYHRIGWVMLNPTSDVAPPPAYRPDTIDEGEDEKRPVHQQSVADKALEAINGKQVKDEIRGDFTCHVGVHAPPLAPRKKALWDLFSAPERIEKDLELATRLIDKYEKDSGSELSAVAQIQNRVELLRSERLLKPAVTAVRKEKAKKESEDHDIGMDEDVEEGEEEDDEGALDDEIDDEDILVKKKQLDLMIEYLRRVFNFCFFCVFESDSIHELTRKCPGGHLRRPRNTLTTAAKAAAKASATGEPFPGKRRDVEDEDSKPPEVDRRFGRPTFSKAEQQLQRAFNWVKTFEEKTMQLLEPEKINVRKLGGRPVEEAMQEELNKYVTQEDEHKFRCKVPECTKLFKEEHFWRKHVEKRHPEFGVSLKNDFELVNTYVSDPAHIAPSRSDANSNGHFPPANGHQPAGTPRGFNLNNFNMPSSFGNASSFFGNGHSGGGPMRRGGGAYQNHRSGPYDRRPGDRRYGNDNAAAGRLSPPGGARGGAALPIRGRWDAQGGAAAGPREAVVGRSLKSYEDLDAVAGGGAGELNY